jgi:hypothetical protein
MDEVLHDQTAGRHGPETESADGAHPARPGAEAGPRAATNEFITVKDGVPSSFPAVVDQANPATAPATRPTELTPTAAGFRIRFCKWCKQIDVRGPRREGDVIAILIIGERVRACWNGRDMIVQDGICEVCADCLKNGRVIDGSTTL